jgi:hypothetical protein
MGASEWMKGRGKPPNALRAKGVEKEEEGIWDSIPLLFHKQNIETYFNSFIPRLYEGIK